MGGSLRRRISKASRQAARRKPAPAGAKGWFLRACGERVSALLLDPHAAERVGEAAQARVRDLFLGPRHLGQYDLLERVLGAA